MQMVRMTIETIGQFVREQMNNRDIKSNREFARLSNINYQSINDLVNDVVTQPDIATLARLSEYTGFSLMSLLKLCFPEVVHIDVDKESLMLAEKISQLPPDKQDIARRYIASAYAEGVDK